MNKSGTYNDDYCIFNANIENAAAPVVPAVSALCTDTVHAWHAAICYVSIRAAWMRVKNTTGTPRYKHTARERLGIHTRAARPNPARELATRVFVC